MSDGNFNRALLPSTPYRSGHKMGEQQMKAKAQQVFTTLIKEKFPTLSDEEQKSLKAEFDRRLSGQ